MRKVPHRQASGAFKTLLANKLRSIMKVHEKTAARAYKEAIKASSGTLSLAELAAMDHPYARRHPSPLLPPELINVQSGEFIGGWQKVPAHIWNGKIVSGVQNMSRPAKYMAGTRVMHARPIAVLITTIVSPRHISEIKKVFTNNG